MKAIVYQKKAAGERLVYSEVAKPTPIKNQVLVKVVCTSVNAADYRSLALGIVPKNNIFGVDVAGVVEALGPDVRRLKLGDEVFGDVSFAGSGGFAEYVAAPEDLFAIKPSGVSFEQAAAVPMAALTALQGMRDVGQIQPGKKVLVYGAGGGVGAFAVQLAKYFGTEVTALCGPANLERVRALGADIVLDYTQTDLTRSRERYDLILGVNGKLSLLAYRRMLAPNGVFVMVGGGLSQVISTVIFGGLLSLGGKKIRPLYAKASRSDLEWVIKLIAEGKITPVIERTYPLRETPAAMRYAGQGHARGKLIIRIGE